MSVPTLTSIIGAVQQRVGTLPDYFLLEDCVVNKFRDVQARIPWTWRRKQGEFVYHAPITTGTVTVLRGYNTITFSAAIATPDIVGRQIRINGNQTPIRTITGIIDSFTATIDRNWGYIDQTSVGFEIYSAYQTVPDDFDSFLTIVDLGRGFQIDWWSHTADELDRVDSRRAYAGNIAYWMVLKDYASDRQGLVFAPVQARGTGSVPSSGGQYIGPNDALFVVEMTGATTFKWRKDNGAYVTGVTIDPGGYPQALQDGITVSFPTSGTYVSGDVFIIKCSAADAPGSPRYEAWPHIKADEARPYLYLAKLPDLNEPGAVVPRYIRPDVLLEMTLADIARWKNPSNGYYDLKLATVHDGRAETMLLDMEREDQARESTDLTYTSWQDLPAYDSEFLASHDVGYEIDVL